MPAMSREPLLAKVRRRVRRAVKGAPASPPSSSAAHLGLLPEVTGEPTNVGPHMDAMVARAQASQQAPGADPDYDLVRENFDHLHYLLQAQAIHEAPDADPVRHFLRRGPEAVNSPDYNFSMKSYLDRYPHLRDGPERSPYLEWLKRGRDAGEIADPAQGIEPMAGVLGLEPARVVEELVAARTDTMERLRTGKLGEMFAKAAEVEPLIAAQWAETTRMRMVPLAARLVAGQMAAIHDCHAAAEFRPARLLVVIDRPHRRADRRPEGHLTHALTETVPADDIVVIYTDAGGGTHDRFPAGVREVDFASAAEGLPDEHKQLALVTLLRSFDAEAIVNIDSTLLYRVLAPYGKALAASERIFLYFSSDERRAAGHWEGWSQSWFYAGFDIVTGFLTDSEQLRARLGERYQLSDDDLGRIHVLRTPVQPASPAAPAEAQPPERAVVHWAGRWDLHDRPDIALEVARRMPDVDFRLHGERRRRLPGDLLPDNARVEGRSANVAKIDLAQATAWLHTSVRESVPSLLLEVAMTEVPIVAGSVGGVTEVLGEDDSWPIDDWEDPEAYVKALREIIASPTHARRRAGQLRERLGLERDAGAYAAQAAAVLLADADGGGDPR